MKKVFMICIEKRIELVLNLAKEALKASDKDDKSKQVRVEAKIDNVSFYIRDCYKQIGETIYIYEPSYDFDNDSSFVEDYNKTVCAINDLLGTKFNTIDVVVSYTMNAKSI